MKILLRVSLALVLCAELLAFGAEYAQPAEVVRFAVIGDWGTGSRRQRETGQMLWKQRERFPYTFVITTGDNLYGSQDPPAFERKFVIPYKAIIDAKIPFYAAIGNHDELQQLNYPLFNMNGSRYYTFTKGPVQFFALDSTLMTHGQLRWLEDELEKSKAQWKIAYFHHPIYSSGRRHGPTLVLQSALQPIFSTHGVRVIFVGHEHFYERLIPRYGIQQFTTGSAGQLRFGNIRTGSLETARGFDTDNSFMLVAIEGDLLTFEAVSRTGMIVDSGTVVRSATTD
jgi:DNA repair exonuclease SbcCD nuclease subunit